MISAPVITCPARGWADGAFGSRQAGRLVTAGLAGAWYVALQTRLAAALRVRPFAVDRLDDTGADGPIRRLQRTRRFANQSLMRTTGRPEPVMASQQRHIIAITLQNESGALTRVAGLFSTRGYNIESLNVAATDDPAVSRLTLVTTGSDAVIHQITQQSLKLVDVVDVEDVTREEHFERELLLVKIKARVTQVGSLWSATQRAGGRVLWDAADSFTIELTSSEADINRFIAEVANFGEVLEVVRSGALAIQKGRQVLES
jgi:acetolactate synthase-1/3 small subunit